MWKRGSADVELRLFAGFFLVFLGGGDFRGFERVISGVVLRGICISFCMYFCICLQYHFWVIAFVVVVLEFVIALKAFAQVLDMFLRLSYYHLRCFCISVQA